jgi:hypothetical protein
MHGLQDTAANHRTAVPAKLAKTNNPIASLTVSYCQLAATSDIHLGMRFHTQHNTWQDATAVQEHQTRSRAEHA